ncbi:MAG: hypothetical protein AAGA77_20955 [Bacteroidota bacterium]
MKRYLILIINVMVIFQIHGQTYTDKKGNVHLWGKVKVDDLKNAEYGEWYTRNMKNYKTYLSETEGKLFAGCSVRIFLGTWCGDTKFLVPKFIETWKAMGLKEDKLELIALHHEGDNYKQGPNDETLGLNIHKVPTFIFEKNGKEMGRIVERTIFDLDTDLMQIANGYPYEERYQGVVMLHKIMDQMDMESMWIEDNVKKIFNTVRREVATSSELNAYGYVLKAQNQLEKAHFVFFLNRRIFPYDPNVIDSYGEILMQMNRWEEAAQEFNEVIRIKGSDQNAVEQLNLIYSEMKKMDSSE